nr:hypothetical protein [Rhodomonas sp. NIES-1006]
MTLYKQCLIFTIEALIGKTNGFPEKLWLQNSLMISKMKIFYKIRKDDQALDFDIFDYVDTITHDRDLYTCLFSEILYLVNFKKKFSQKNINRIVENYFKIISLSIKQRTNILVLPRQIVQDHHYLNTLALSNLYILNEFYYDQKKTQI